MIVLFQFPWSPFCITVRHILKCHQIPHRIHNIPSHDRTAVIRATHGKGYTVPCLIDETRVVWDKTDWGQEVSRYVNRRFKLDLFPQNQEGLQSILSQYIENDLAGVGFKVNDSYVMPQLPLVERTMGIRHKERKFGKRCVDQWTRDQAKLIVLWEDRLRPIDNMLASSVYLITNRPLFVDYNLFGTVGNYLYNGKTKLPPFQNLRRWHLQMIKLLP